MQMLISLLCTMDYGAPNPNKGNLQKIKLLMDNKIDLYAFSPSLDAHMEVGNNKTMATRLNLINVERF